MYAALGDHIRRYRRIDAAGEERHRRAAAADRQAARAGQRRAVDIGGALAHLHMDGKLRGVHVHGRFRKRLGQLAADVLADFDGGHRERLVRAAGLDLEALRFAHGVRHILDGFLRHRLGRFVARGGAHHGGDAEHLRHGLLRFVHVDIVRLRLDIDRGLRARYVKLAERAQTALDVGDELLLKVFLVQTLENDLALLEKNDVLHIDLTHIVVAPPGRSGSPARHNSLIYRGPSSPSCTGRRGARRFSPFRCPRRNRRHRARGRRQRRAL